MSEDDLKQTIEKSEVEKSKSRYLDLLRGGCNFPAIFIHHHSGDSGLADGEPLHQEDGCVSLRHLGSEERNRLTCAHRTLDQVKRV